jgi:uroporphyrinogen decarboxylase
MTPRERLLTLLRGEIPDCVPCFMLNGSVDEVVAASKRCIDEAGRGGGFVLSTGDQCPRDTPFENILAMVETARDYGRYPR